MRKGILNFLYYLTNENIRISLDVTMHLIVLFSFSTRKKVYSAFSSDSLFIGVIFSTVKKLILTLNDAGAMMHLGIHVFVKHVMKAQNFFE